jgi:hypothetical protein
MVEKRSGGRVFQHVFPEKNLLMRGLVEAGLPKQASVVTS